MRKHWGWEEIEKMLREQWENVQFHSMFSLAPTGKRAPFVLNRPKSEKSSLRGGVVPTAKKEWLHHSADAAEAGSGCTALWHIH